MGHQKRYFIYLFLLPAVIVSFVFMLYPIIWTIYISFTGYNLFQPGNNGFVGFANYIKVFEDPSFLSAFENTVLFAIFYIPIMTMVSLLVGVLLYSIKKGSSVFRTLIFIPFAIPLTMATLMWAWVLIDGGVVSSMIAFLHFPHISWFGTPISTIFTTTIITNWNLFGFNSIIILSGLYQIPREIFESAQLDGINWWQQFIKITLPLLKSNIFVVIILSLISAFKAYAQIWSLSRGGGSVDVLYTYMYKMAFMYGYFNQAAVVAIVMGIMIALGFYLSSKFVKGEGSSLW
ncbi:MAG: carbohydrate ABC transporter permease [Caldisphaera sp.]